MPKARWKWPRAGECRVCGCVEEAACTGGCSWVDDQGRPAKGQTSLCSSCSGTKRDLAHALASIPRLIGMGRGHGHYTDPRLVARWAGRRAAARAIE